MAENGIVLKPRDVGSSVARACRREGLVPGIIYGRTVEPLAVAIDALAFRRLTSGKGSHVHHVTVEAPHFDGDVMVQEVVYDPLSGKALHIDLHRVSMTEKVKAEVPVVISGEAAMDKSGLILQRQLREIAVESLPGDIPNSVTIDVAELKHGESITAGEIALPANVKLVTAAAEIVVVAVSPKAAEETEEEKPEGEVAEAEKPENPVS